MDRSVGSPWTRCVVGVSGPGVSVFRLPHTNPVVLPNGYSLNRLLYAGDIMLTFFMYISSSSWATEYIAQTL